MEELSSYCRISFTIEAGTRPDIESSCVEINGLVSDCEDSSLVMGKVRLYLVDIELARREGFGAFDAFDTLAQTLEYYGPLWDKESGFYHPALELLTGEDILDLNLLIADRLEIVPQFRGYGLGLVVLHESIRQFMRGCGLVALTPYPLQFAEGIRAESNEWNVQMNYAQLGGSARSGTAKLRRYYSRLGFVSVPRSKIMVLNPAVGLRAVDDVLTKDANARRSTK